MAVAGWLTLLAQSMVAAPLWAAAHAMPEGEGFAGERAKQGYMLLMNVAIRPILLVIGFVLAMGMVWAVTWMSQILMTSALSSMITAQGVNMSQGKDAAAAVANGISQIASLPSMTFGIIAIFIISTAVTIILIHRSFDLIFETADDVMKWIGGSSGALGGESQNTSKALNMIGMQFNRMESKLLGAKMGAGGGGGRQAVTPKGDTPTEKTNTKDPSEHVPGSNAPQTQTKNEDQSKTSKGTGG